MQTNVNTPRTVALGMLVMLGAGQAIAPSSVAAADDQQESYQLTAIIRDFKAKELEGGHPDFQAYAGTTRVGLVDEQLGDDGKPVLKSLCGQRIVSEFKDAQGRNINPAMFDPDLSDTAGVLEARTDKRVTSEESFSSWYRDVPGVNMTAQVDLTFVEQGDTGVFVFDSAVDPFYRIRGGFFPIDGELFGDYGSWGSNFHFTTEIDTEFTYKRGAGWVFKFTGDDDVWVFIDGRLVIDLGSLHPIREQFLELDRLDWLADGEVYQLKIFHAERRTSASNFRMETTIPLRSVELPTTGASYD
jgi:fibro-slime domain-containing protein